MAITLSSDYIYVLAMLKTTPLVVTVGLSLTIPLAVAGDFMLGKPSHAQILTGAFLVLGSFVLVGVVDSKQVEEERRSLVLGAEDTAPLPMYEDVGRDDTDI
jgi:solute carrier family 35 protein F5